MARISPSRTDEEIEQRVKELIKELFEQCNNQHEQELMLAELRESVRRYEEQYGISSDCIHDAIEAGELVEDRDVGHWIFQHDLLRSVEED